MRQIILASVSPRRKQLMEKLGIEFKAIDSGYRERHHKHLKPIELVKFLALGKAKAAAKKYPKAIIIAADTLVVYRNHVLGKPKNQSDAKKMLAMLSGKVNYILTGLCVIDARKDKVFCLARCTKIMFKKYSEREVDLYVATGEPLDKAGAYAIQGWGKRLVKKLTGDKDSAVGLPLNDLKKVLRKLDYF